MSRITIRYSDEIDKKITMEASKNNCSKAEYVRNILAGKVAGKDNIGDKLSFYSDINDKIDGIKEELVKIKETLNVITIYNNTITKIDNDVLIGNQLLCHLLLVTKKREDIQRIIDNAKRELKKNE